MSALHRMEFGGLVVMCVIAAVFFIRFWATTKDRFFLWFAGAFVTFGVSWGLLGFDLGAENTHLIFIVRLTGFLMIIAAIISKNAQQKREP